MFEAEDFPGMQKYADCPIAFSGTSGDQVIQTSDGKFAWCVPEEGKVKRLTADFAGLLERYVKHRRVGDGHPFDSYGR